MYQNVPFWAGKCKLERIWIERVLNKNSDFKFCCFNNYTLYYIFILSYLVIYQMDLSKLFVKSIGGFLHIAGGHVLHMIKIQYLTA